ncbi:peroxisomal sarcosine oxidase isoform X3 [Leucoraja erinacea]|uniref:peroxisomal sarcosine oxidase isoform X3 n=1 Tax=Leucoraja erinaceus TaxID=7782 RepID=UPI002454F789|nr:peroxisomal sarcosine oxidase isoform X3 [Leucoraja erinacea]
MCHSGRVAASQRQRSGCVERAAGGVCKMSVQGEVDTIVIGAGIQGSYTAYHLSKHSKTLLIDQFALPHARGSSHGQTRIIRNVYAKTYYTAMMTECYQLWKQLEAETNTELFRPTGLLVLGKEGNPSFQTMKSTLIDNNVPMTTLTSADVSKRFPAVQLPRGVSALLDKTAGILYADRALKNVQDLFRRFGGIIRDGEKVVQIQPSDLVTVTTTAGIYRAKRLVITAGPWTNKLLNLVGLQLPLEVCYHSGSRADPDERDVSFQRPSQDVELLRDFLSREFPGLDPNPAVVESCMYTNTPDYDFILDHHPDHKNIIVGAGFSGHGFKLAPVVGKVLSELCLGEKPSYDLSPFKICRFHLKSVL